MPFRSKANVSPKIVIIISCAINKMHSISIKWNSIYMLSENFILHKCKHIFKLVHRNCLKIHFLRIFLTNSELP